MRRMVLGLSYDGTVYHGWQIQEDSKTVQGLIDPAISAVANHPVVSICAGRTDAGVHATAQVVHFDTDADRTDYSWVFGINSHLPHDISVLWVRSVESSFHARYSALARRYRYVLYNHSIRPAILRSAVGWEYRLLNEKCMQEGAQYLLGEHDFNAFRGAGCQASSPVRTIKHIHIFRIRHMVIIEIEANAFLFHMVRNIVGVLIAIGTGERLPEWARDVLASRDRRKGGVTVSPCGLYLVGVDYPPEFQLPRTPLGPFFFP